MARDECICVSCLAGEVFYPYLRGRQLTHYDVMATAGTGHRESGQEGHRVAVRHRLASCIVFTRVEGVQKHYLHSPKTSKPLDAGGCLTLERI